MPDTETAYVAAVQREVRPLIDLLVLVNDCAGLLGGTVAAQIDTLVRHRIAALIETAAVEHASANDRLLARSVLAAALTATGESP